MDKYEKVAERFVNAINGPLTAYDMSADWLPYFLADALRLYDAQREKETCETCCHLHFEPRINQGKEEMTRWCLNEESEMWDVQILHDGFCCNKYSRRIVEVQK